jgi:hypothetical protein
VRPEPGKKVAPIRTQARSATILPNFVGLKFQVHNGKVYHDVTITEEMVGHKLGEFSPYDMTPLPRALQTFQRALLLMITSQQNKEDLHLEQEIRKRLLCRRCGARPPTATASRLGCRGWCWCFDVHIDTKRVTIRGWEVLARS